MRFAIRQFTVIVLCCLFAGCGDPNMAKRGEVSGNVILDGQPIERGTIEFRPTNGTTGPTAGAEIINGAYSIDRKVGPPAGEALIMLHSGKYTGKKVPSRAGDRMVDEIIELFPPSLNDNSTIVRKIVPGKNEINFDLKSDSENK